jgi:hypothetical protein
MEIGCSRNSDITPVKITEHPVSSPDESPMPRSLEDRFSGSSDPAAVFVRFGVSHAGAWRTEEAVLGSPNTARGRCVPTGLITVSTQPKAEFSNDTMLTCSLSARHSVTAWI